MENWNISDQDIESTEQLLLPEGCHFSSDAKDVIRCWHSVDVAACPGSGKTTVLLAKLKLLADKMPLRYGAGICVLSHTNVAVDEVSQRLSAYANKLLSYPNYIGTIQSFIDKFLAVPYLRSVVGRNVQVVDDDIYIRRMKDRMQKAPRLQAFVQIQVKNNKAFDTHSEYLQALSLREDGGLYIKEKKVASEKSDSAKEYKALIEDLLNKDGIIRYADAYSYAKTAMSTFSEIKEHLSQRFKYVFIDEYQDCSEDQRELIKEIFNPKRCEVFKIGDPDQAIYNSLGEKTTDWIPANGYLSITKSCRYSQEIANVICKLKKSDQKIDSLKGNVGIKPVLLVFPEEKIDRVITEFIKLLDKYSLDDKGVYKAIGAIKKPSIKGVKIGSYWPEFDGSVKKQRGNTYWGMIDEIIQNLSSGDLYKAEYVVRVLLCRLFHYTNYPGDGTEYSVVTVKNLLNEQHRDVYREMLYEFSLLSDVNRETIHQYINQFIKNIVPNVNDILGVLPEYFTNKGSNAGMRQKLHPNEYIDQTGGRRIVFDTIHGVKGETHDATLYLETDRKGSSDLKRIFPYFAKDRKKKNQSSEFSRKLAYVGMSRAKKLLCVAIKEKTYEEGKQLFTDDWKVVDLRG